MLYKFRFVDARIDNKHTGDWFYNFFILKQSYANQIMDVFNQDYIGIVLMNANPYDYEKDSYIKWNKITHNWDLI